MNVIHLWPEPREEKAAEITVGFTLEMPTGERLPYWFRLPVEYGQALSRVLDPFVVASIFIAMGTGADLMAHGTVSASLLRNLEEFQLAWSDWYPGIYTKVEILAEAEDEPVRATGDAALTVFSGGVDSCFTAWRHHSGQAGRQSRNLRAGLMIHGFDIPLRETETFERAAAKAQRMLASLDMDFIRMANNLRSQPVDNRYAHAAHLAAAMLLLQGRFSAGMIPATYTYSTLDIYWGSNPATDIYLTNDAFTLIHDGAGSERLEKLDAIAAWPEAMQDLRVCLNRDGALRDENCCRCEKCVRTILSLRSLGLERPLSFPRDVSNRQILALKMRGLRVLYHKAILQTARRRGQRGTWVWALRAAYDWNLVKGWIKGWLGS